MVDFWNDLIVEKSWNALLDLKKEKFNFILIGGWAVYLWNKVNKSKDIDIVVNDFKDLNFLKNKYDLRKNDNLKKYEIKMDDVDIDIYVPFFSKLAIPAEDIKNYTSKIEGFNVANIEVLLILKQGAELDRRYSVKGEKDRIDVMVLLLFTSINFKRYSELLKKYRLGNYLSELKNLIKNFKDIGYLGLNVREYKLKKGILLEKLKKIK